MRLLEFKVHLVGADVVGIPTEESALPIAGKKSNLKRALFIEYLAIDRARPNRGAVPPVHLFVVSKELCEVGGKIERNLHVGVIY